MRSVAIRASLSCTSWNSASGTKLRRVRVASASSRARAAMPQAAAPARSRGAVERLEPSASPRLGGRGGWPPAPGIPRTRLTQRGGAAAPAREREPGVSAGTTKHEILPSSGDRWSRTRCKVSYPRVRDERLLPSARRRSRRAARSRWRPRRAGPDSVIANAPWRARTASSSQRDRIASFSAKWSGTAASPWRAKTASARGDAAASASRVRQQARQSRRRIGSSHPPSPRRVSHTCARVRASASSLGSGSSRAAAAANAPTTGASARCGSSRKARTAIGSGRLMPGTWARAWPGRPHVRLAEVRALHELRLTSACVSAAEVERPLGVERALRTASASAGPRARRSASVVASSRTRSTGTTAL